MKVFLISSLAVFFACPAPPPPPDAPPKAAQEVTMKLYAADRAIHFGDAPDVVVEIQNGTDRELVIDERAVGVEREVRTEPNKKYASVAKDQRTPATGCRVVVKCQVPPRSQLRFLSLRRTPHEARKRTIPPGGSLLIKVELPKDAFEVGDCNLTAIFKERDTVLGQSKPFNVQCEPAAENGTK